MLDGQLLWFKRFLHRRMRRTKSANAVHEPPRRGCHYIGRTVVVGLLLFLFFIGLLELQLRPVVEQMSANQVNNRITWEINTALMQYLDQKEDLYASLTVIERDAEGAITAVTSDMAQINRLRGAMVETVLRTIAEVDTHTLGVPIGNLFDLDLLWAKGPRIGVRSLVSGTVSAEMNSQFEAAGINQTLHRIMLDIRVPLAVMLPGCSTTTQIELSVCVAETIIVGTVPETYLQIDAVPTGER